MKRHCLFIFFLKTLRATAFLIQQLPHIARWLWQKTQAEPRKEKFLIPNYKATLFFDFL
jgi:hypothetical protein